MEYLGSAADDRPGACGDAAPVLERLADGRHGRVARPRDAGRPCGRRRRRPHRERGPSGGGARHYGIALFGGGFTGTPHLGVELSDTGRDYRLGWRLTSARKGDPDFEIGLDTTRREAANDDAEHGLMLRGAIRWLRRRAAAGHPAGGCGGAMATGGCARGWQFLKRNDHCGEACRALADGAPEHQDAPFPIRLQSRADLKAAPWGLLAWEYTFAPAGPAYASAMVSASARALTVISGIATRELRRGGWRRVRGWGARAGRVS